MNIYFGNCLLDNLFSVCLKCKETQELIFLSYRILNICLCTLYIFFNFSSLRVSCKSYYLFQFKRYYVYHLDVCSVPVIEKGTCHESSLILSATTIFASKENMIIENSPPFLYFFFICHFAFLSWNLWNINVFNVSKSGHCYYSDKRRRFDKGTWMGRT